MLQHRGTVRAGLGARRVARGTYFMFSLQAFQHALSKRLQSEQAHGYGLARILRCLRGVGRLGGVEGRGPGDAGARDIAGFS